MDTSRVDYLAQFVIGNTGDEEMEKEHCDVIAAVIGNLAQYLADYMS